MRPPRSTPRLPAERTSSARWSNTAPFRRVAGFRRYNGPYACPELTHYHINLRHLEPITKRMVRRAIERRRIDPPRVMNRNQTDRPPTPQPPKLLILNSP